jgi:prenyltransferase beta subunit
MWTRRNFLGRGTIGLLGVAGTALGFPGDAADNRGETTPDGSDSRGMITPEADAAIEQGLAYLKSHCHVDGSFGTAPGYAGNVAVTSLAALAFMSGGHLPGRGPYGRIVTNALRFVMSKEDVAGGRPGFLHNPAASPHGPMYGHGFATLFLAEAYGTVHDRKLRQEVHDKLRRAVTVILESQNSQGGWRYFPEPREADLSVTICQIMALRAARNAGVSVPKAKVDRCVEYVKRCQDKKEGWFRYQAEGGGMGGPQGFARTAAGVVALYSAGIYKGPEVEAGLRFLNSLPPNRGGGFHGVDRPDMHYFYGHYYAVQAMWTAGGDNWARWYPAIRDELISRRRPDGYWIDAICAHYATAMACIILQIPNNYLTILQK